MKKSALVIGASSGIGLEIAKLLSRQGYRLGIAARRKELLDQYAATDPNIVAVEAMDLTAADLPERFEALSEKVMPIDAIYITSGIGLINPSLDWSLENSTIQTNVTGFAHLCGKAVHLFETQGYGHLIAVSSIAGLRGSGEAPAYGASKAFMSRYLQALRFRAQKSGMPIHVTDIRPGFVDTAMMKADRPFWVSTPQKAAARIVSSAERKKKISYLGRRWSLAGWILKHLPE